MLIYYVAIGRLGWRTLSSSTASQNHSYPVDRFRDISLLLHVLDELRPLHDLLPGMTQHQRSNTVPGISEGTLP